MSQIEEGTRDAKTITFPSTIREVSDRAFENTTPMSVIVNEGLRRSENIRTTIVLEPFVVRG